MYEKRQTIPRTTLTGDWTVMWPKQGMRSLFNRDLITRGKPLQVSIIAFVDYFGKNSNKMHQHLISYDITQNGKSPLFDDLLNLAHNQKSLHFDFKIKNGRYEFPLESKVAWVNPW